MLISLKTELCAYSRPSSETAITRGNKLAKHINVFSCGQNIVLPVGDGWNFDNISWPRHQVLDTLKLLAASKAKAKTICFFPPFFFFFFTYQTSLMDTFLVTVGSEDRRPTQPSGKLFADKCSFRTRQQGCDQFSSWIWVEAANWMHNLHLHLVILQTLLSKAIYNWGTHKVINLEEANRQRKCS